MFRGAKANFSDDNSKLYNSNSVSEPNSEIRSFNSTVFLSISRKDLKVFLTLFVFFM